MPSEAKKRRSRRTRDDPFERSWATEVVPSLAADVCGKLDAKNAARGVVSAPDKVYFVQVHEPALTRATELGVTVEEPLRHLSFQLVRSYG